MDTLDDVGRNYSLSVAQQFAVSKQLPAVMSDLDTCRDILEGHVHHLHAIKEKRGSVEAMPDQQALLRLELVLMNVTDCIVSEEIQ
jgi:hypothetical protein